MFYTQRGSIEADPDSLYRSPYEIRRDISRINEKIRETDGKINIRILLTDLLSRCSEDGADDYIPSLEGAILEADSVIDGLKELKGWLGELKRELEETVWVLGIETATQTRLTP